MHIRRINRIIISAMLVFMLVTSIICTPIFAALSQQDGKSAITLETNRFIIKYKNEQGSNDVGSAIKDKTNTTKKIKNKKNKHFDVITTKKKMSQNELLNEIKSRNADSNIEYIQPDYEVNLSSNDTYFSSQWGVSSNDKTTTSAISANVEPAWEISQGDGVTIAIIDSGIDITHEDLKDNIWINTKEISGNGIDDDGNGYIDDINGWNFSDDNTLVHDQSTVYDEDHGTHVAGIIGAIKDNDKGIAGVAPKVKIMLLKAFKNSIANTSDIIAAIEFAENNGAKIVNCSWGSTDENPALKEAIESSNMLFVCAAGNNGVSIDINPVYPASYTSSNVISVASMDRSGNLSSTSNYGINSVDVAAPGEGIYSTLPGNAYGYKSGTSMAAPFVSGEAALILSKYGSINAADIKNKIISHSDSIASLNDKVSNGNKIDCNYAVTGQKSNIDVQPEATQSSTTYTQEYNLVTNSAIGLFQDKKYVSQKTLDDNSYSLFSENMHADSITNSGNRTNSSQFKVFANNVANSGSSGVSAVKFYAWTQDEGNNLLSNSSFNDGTTNGWAISNAAEGTSQVVSNGWGGNKALEIKVASSGDQYQHTSFNHGIDVGGRTFTYSVYVKTEGIQREGIRIFSYFYDSAGNILPESWSSRSQSISETNDWTRLTVTSTAPQGTYSTSLIIGPADKNGEGRYWISAAMIEENKTRNILSNPSFNDSTTNGWIISNATEGTSQVVSNGWGGNKALEIKVASSGDQYQHVSFNHGIDVGGRTFTYSIYVKTEGIQGEGIRIFSYLYDSAGNILPESWSSHSQSISGTNDWTRLTVTSTAPQGAYSTSLIIGPADKNGAGKYWISDAMIEENTQATAYVNGKTRNILSNSSFNNDTTNGWAISNATEGTSQVVSNGWGENKALEIKVASSGDQYQHVSFNHGIDVGGRTFTYSIYVKTEGIQGEGIRIFSYLYDSAGNILPESWSSHSQSISGTNDWTRLTVTSTAPQGAYSTSLIIGPADNNGAGRYWISAAMIEEGMRSTPYVSGIGVYEQDDAKWYDGTNSENANWNSTIDITEHFNESGKYIVQAFAYDNVGNCSYIGSTTITVDRVGILPGIVYQYDDNNRLIYIYRNSKLFIQFKYDNNGNLISKQKI